MIPLRAIWANGLTNMMEFSSNRRRKDFIVIVRGNKPFSVLFYLLESILFFDLLLRYPSAVKIMRLRT